MLTILLEGKIVMQGGVLINMKTRKRSNQKEKDVCTFCSEPNAKLFHQKTGTYICTKCTIDCINLIKQTEQLKETT
jgi:ribosomal protein L37AE/L43A